MGDGYVCDNSVHPLPLPNPICFFYGYATVCLERALALVPTLRKPVEWHTIVARTSFEATRDLARSCESACAAYASSSRLHFSSLLLFWICIASQYCFGWKTKNIKRNTLPAPTELQSTLSMPVPHAPKATGSLWAIFTFMLQSHGGALAFSRTKLTCKHCWAQRGRSWQAFATALEQCQQSKHTIKTKMVRVTNCGHNFALQRHHQSLNCNENKEFYHFNNRFSFILAGSGSDFTPSTLTQSWFLSTRNSAPIFIYNNDANDFSKIIKTAVMFICTLYI